MTRPTHSSAAGIPSPVERDVWRLYVEPAIGDLRLGGVEGGDVAAMLRSLRDQGLSETTCKNALTVLGAVYRLARSRRLLARSPIDELDAGERPRPKVMKRRQLDERSLAALVREAPEPTESASPFSPSPECDFRRLSRFGGATSTTSSRSSTSAGNSHAHAKACPLA